MEIFCNIVNVFITFDQFKASLKRINLYTAPPPPPPPRTVRYEAFGSVRITNWTCVKYDFLSATALNKAAQMT